MIACACALLQAVRVPGRHVTAGPVNDPDVPISQDLEGHVCLHLWEGQHLLNTSHPREIAWMLRVPDHKLRILIRSDIYQATDWESDI